MSGKNHRQAVKRVSKMKHDFVIYCKIAFSIQFKSTTPVDSGKALFTLKKKSNNKNDLIYFCYSERKLRQVCNKITIFDFSTTKANCERLEKR